MDAVSLNNKNTKYKAVISWPGYGILFFWQLGILQVLQATYDLSRCQMVGSSAGALLSVLAACNVQPQQALDRAYELCIEHGVFSRPLGLIGVWGGIVQQWLHELLPADAAQRCNGGHVRIVLTTLPFLNRLVVSEFKDRDDVIETALASAHLPFILNWNLAAKWRGQSCVDGSLLYILTRRCQYLKPTSSSSSSPPCPLLLFDPFHDLGLLNISSIIRCISLTGNSKATVQQLLSQGVVYAQRLVEKGAFAVLPPQQQQSAVKQGVDQSDGAGEKSAGPAADKPLVASMNFSMNCVFQPELPKVSEKLAAAPGACAPVSLVASSCTS